VNILGLVFSLLLILSYTFYSISDKQTTATRVRNVYIGSQKANRALLNKYQSLQYNALNTRATHKEEPTAAQEKAAKPKPPELNRECAKFNLWPLIQEGQKTHPQLYELTAKMLRTLYGHNLFKKEKRAEYAFLDALIAAGKNEGRIEKIAMPTPELQRLYYKMLKGTKTYSLAGSGIAPLTDFLKIETANTKICLCHAHPDLIAAVFSMEVANKLYSELHQKNPPPLSKEMIENVCLMSHYSLSDLMIFELLELGRPHHQELKKTLLAEDQKSHISLRKNIYLKS
jgi:hypothetical protein